MYKSHYVKPYIDHIYRPLGTVLFQPGKMATLPQKATFPGNHNISHPSFHCCTHGFSLHLNHYTERLARLYHREHTELTSNTSAICQPFIYGNVLSEHAINALEHENVGVSGRTTVVVLVVLVLAALIDNIYHIINI